MPYVAVKPAGITSATEAEIAGDLTVDTNTLHVDAANNRVGVGTTSPSQAIDAVATGSSTSVILAQNTTSNNGAAHLRAKNPQNELIIGTDNHSGGLTGTANASFLYTSSTTPIIFMPNGTEKMRLLSGGGLDLSAGNLVLDNGYGIDFSATANSSGTVTHEILDDYEIGTFAGTIAPASSGSYSLASTADLLNYTKIGRQVLITGELQVSAISSPSGNYIRLSGLPFTIASTTDLTERSTGMTLIYPSGGTPNVCAVYAYSGTAVDILKDASVVGVGTSVTFQFTYIT
jgi:hypothetical protein